MKTEKPTEKATAEKSSLIDKTPFFMPRPSKERVCTLIPTPHIRTTITMITANITITPNTIG
jgi:hypothetical protein